jgi:hypothetical protein
MAQINNIKQVEMLTTNRWLVPGELIGKPNTNQQLVVNARVTVFPSVGAGADRLR